MIVEIYFKTAGEVLKDPAKEMEDLMYLPLFIWGAFGIGKSATVREAAKEIALTLSKEYSEELSDINNPDKFLLITIPLHQLDAAELKGIGVPDYEREVSKFLPPEFLPKKGQGIIFFDEFNYAPPLVQVNAAHLIYDRRLFSYEVPPGYIIIAAGDIEEERAYTHRMSPFVSTRFLHVQLKPPTIG